MTGGSQENWMDKLDVTVKAGYKSFLEGWQAASAMLQEQADAINPAMATCTCKRACDNSQFVMPAVVADDEVAYPYSGDQVSSGPSPFSPREGSLATTAKVLNLTPSPLKHLTYNAPKPSDSNDVKPFVLEGTEDGMDQSSAPVEQKPSRFLRYPEESQEVPAFVPPPDYMGNFGYYSEYSPVLRPPTSICTTNVNTAVRAAPWDKWLNNGKTQAAASQTGSSLVSKGGAGCSQASNALQNLQPTVEGERKPQLVQASNFASTQSSQAGSDVPVDSSSRNGAKDEIAGSVDAKSDVNIQHSSVQDLTAAPQLQDASPQPSVPKIKVKSDMKSVLSQSTALKSSVALALSQTAPEQFLRSAEAALETPGPARRSIPEEPAKPSMPEVAEVKRSIPEEPAKPSIPEGTEATAPAEKVSKPRRTDASDRKSALSVSTPMSSSAAMSLGGLGKVSSKRRSNEERGSTESVVIGTSPAVSTTAATLGSKIVDDGSAPVTGGLKPPKAANRQGASPRKPRGPDAKSVISGLNSSSSASALLGPMMLGQPKRRSARPEGADVASVI